MSNFLFMKRSVQPFCVAVMLLATLMVIPTGGMAQQQNNVTLRLEVGNTVESISGEFVSFEDGKFTINSSLGTLVIPADGVSCVGDVCPESTRLKITTDQMILRAIDGSFTITGQLIEVSGDSYVIATSVGEMMVEIELAECEGVGCIETNELPVFGGQVVLSNETTTLRGTLLGIVEDDYVLEEEALGSIRVKMERFTCSGEGCP